MMDREIIRSLATEYAQYANDPKNKENEKLFRAVNGKKMIRPVVLIDEIPWNQLADEDEMKMKCTGDMERAVEWFLRNQLYRWKHFPCDMILTPYIPWGKHIKVGSYGVEVHENILAADKGNNIVSHAYIDQLPDEESIDKLHAPTIEVDEAADKRDEEMLNDLLSGILPVRMTGITYAGFYEPWDDIAMWRGAENLLWDLIDRPEYTHMLMEKLLSVRMEHFDRLEKMNLLDACGPYIHCTVGFADDLDTTGSITRKNMWGRGAAQIFASVSPRMTQEFEIDYAKRFFEGFGLVYYGCCEPLDKKIDIVKKLPNLRKVSITPWANVDESADKLGSDYVLAYKPNPAFVATETLDESAIENEIRRALNACRRNGISCEFTLKDISSIHRNPQNLERWAEIAMRLVTE
ncbi:MAG: hypothetical protein IJN21_06210 [Clostridia bacterium]|nr:hypothetical protein [Clostridia bacterium]